MNEKSSENFDAANLLVDNNMFAASIHCYYYSCFQFSKYVVNESGITYSRQNEGGGFGSHTRIINETSNLISEFDRVSCLNYLTNMDKLKRMRKKADYSVEVINVDETQNARNWAETVKNILTQL